MRVLTWNDYKAMQTAESDEVTQAMGDTVLCTNESFKDDALMIQSGDANLIILEDCMFENSVVDIFMPNGGVVVLNQCHFKGGMCRIKAAVIYVSHCVFVQNTQEPLIVMFDALDNGLFRENTILCPEESRGIERHPYMRSPVIADMDAASPILIARFGAQDDPRIIAFLPERNKFYVNREVFDFSEMEHASPDDIASLAPKEFSTNDLSELVLRWPDIIEACSMTKMMLA